MSEKTVEVLAKLASQKYEREITPEQYVAADYFAKEAALAYKSAEGKDHTPAVQEKDVKSIEQNARDSYLASGNLSALVKQYKLEMKDSSIQEQARARRVQKRVEEVNLLNSTDGRDGSAIAEKVLKVLAKEASQKYGREISPVQYAAADYFAKEAAIAYKSAEGKNHTPAVQEKHAKTIEQNSRDSHLASSNLDALVKQFKLETKDPFVQKQGRADRAEKRMGAVKRMRTELHKKQKRP